MTHTKYLGWMYRRNVHYPNEPYEAWNIEREYRASWLFAKTLTELRAKIKRHVERWGW